MNTYIALLRGINVSGQKKIKMKELVSLLQDDQLTDVRYYLQSGNIIFQTKLQKTAAAKKIYHIILAEYGYSVPVLITDKNEMSEILNSSPYSKKETKFQYFTFMFDLPNIEDIQKIPKLNSGDDEYTIINKTVYIYCPEGAGKTKLNNNFFEKKLKVTATSRNFNTVSKLIELS